MRQRIQFSIPDEDYQRLMVHLPGGYEKAGVWARIAFYQIVNKALRRAGEPPLGSEDHYEG